MDEVGNVAPIMLIFFIKFKDGSESLALNIQPNLTHILIGQLASFTRVMNTSFEIVKGNLTDNGVQHVFDFASDHHFAQYRIDGLCQQTLKRKHFTKHTCCLGDGQWGICQYFALLTRQQLVHPVA